MITFVSVAVAILGCLLAISASITTGKINRNLDQERYEKLLAQEQLQQANSRVKTLEAEVTDSRNKIESILKILNEGKSTTSNLESQLDNLTKENELLKQQIEQLNQPPPESQQNQIPNS